MRTAIFIDGLTLYYMLDRKRINFNNFKQWLLKEDTEAFSGYFNKIKDVDSKAGFFSHIEKSGFTLFINKLEFNKRFNDYEMKNVDMDITIEALKRVNDYDKIIIVSGKKDLIQLCETLTLQAKIVVVAATKNSMSAAFNKYEQMFLDEYLEHHEELHNGL